MKYPKFNPVYTRKGYLNKRRTATQIASQIFTEHKTATGWDITEAVQDVAVGDLVFPVSLCDLTARRESLYRYISSHTQYDDFSF